MCHVLDSAAGRGGARIQGRLFGDELFLRNRNVLNQLLNPFRYDQLLDPLSGLYLWKLLYFRLFQHKRNPHDVPCRLFCNDLFLIHCALLKTLLNLLLDSPKNLHLWNLLYFHLFQHRKKAPRCSVSSVQQRLVPGRPD